MLNGRTPALRRLRLPPWQAWWLVLALLGAQGLGWWHGLLHSPALVVAHAVADPDSAALFAHEAGSSTCRLLDQLAPDALVLPVLALAVVLPPPLCLVLLNGLPQAPPSTGLPQARAPPAARGG